jgi:hypothetical protein
MLANFVDALLDRRGHCLMHGVNVGTLHEIRSPAITAEQIFKFLVRDAGEQRWIIDLVPIEMEDRQNGTVARGIQEFVDMPRRR